MNEIYEKLKEFAIELNNNKEKVIEDNKSIIIGVADCNNDVLEVFLSSGNLRGIIQMYLQLTRLLDREMQESIDDEIERMMDDDEVNTDLN